LNPTIRSQTPPEEALGPAGCVLTHAQCSLLSRLIIAAAENARADGAFYAVDLFDELTPEELRGAVADWNNWNADRSVTGYDEHCPSDIRDYQWLKYFADLIGTRRAPQPTAAPAIDGGAL
jgi:hypothetical protein